MGKESFQLGRGRIPETYRVAFGISAWNVAPREPEEAEEEL